MRRITVLTAFLLSLTLTLSLTGVFSHGTAIKAQPTVAKNTGNDSVFLLIGVDQASYSSDVMMLVRMRDASLSFLQIPRDSLMANGRRLNSVFAAACHTVKNEGGSDKEAYAAGSEALEEVLEKGLGVAVTAHATLTLKGLRTLVDCLGGVDLTLDRALSYEDPTQGLTIRLEAGTQHLDGTAAEGLVRCRNAYPDADYGRMRAQRKLIAAVFHKVQEELAPLAMLSLFRKAYHEVETDLAFMEALPLLKRLSDQSTVLEFATVAGESYRLGGAAVEVLSEVNLKKAAAYLGGSFDTASCRGVFCHPDGDATVLYESKTPPPFLIDGVE